MPSNQKYTVAGLSAAASASASAWLKRVGRLGWSKIQAKARRYAGIALWGLLGFLVIISGYLWAIHRPLDFGEQTWVIKSGDTLNRVAMQLIDREVIDYALVLKLLAYKGDRGRQIRAGEYRFPPKTSLNEFLQRIVSGRGQVGIKVTIIEGWAFRHMRAHLRKAPKLKQVTAEMSDRQIMAELGHPNLYPEGQFFPDTYTYTAGQSDLSIYRKAFQLMRNKLDLAWENRASGLILADQNEALIMASIIEKESWVAKEQPKIAGVFYNRLKKGMRLQTDPTVIYGLGAGFDGNLTRAHLKADTHYNTYTRKGLPPTPISLPGDDAIKAALHPISTDAYYFVAKGGGKHQFSETLAQHNKAVQEYIRRKKNAHKDP